MPIKKKRISPRQKMINLMYVVLMAMLALNVSSDVLNGFSLVSDSLNKSTQNSNEANQGIYAEFEKQIKQLGGFGKIKFFAGFGKALIKRAKSLK